MKETRMNMPKIQKGPNRFPRMGSESFSPGKRSSSCLNHFDMSGLASLGGRRPRIQGREGGHALLDEDAVVKGGPFLQQRGLEDLFFRAWLLGLHISPEVFPAHEPAESRTAEDVGHQREDVGMLVTAV